MKEFNYKLVKDINPKCLALLKHLVKYCLIKELNPKENIDNLFYKIKNEMYFFTEREILNGVIRHRIINIIYKEIEIFNEFINLKKDLNSLIKKEKIDAIKLSSLTKEISFLFENHNIPYLVLKGIPLSIQTTGYENSRGLGDLDILIDKNNLKKSIRLLKKYNFEFTFGSTLDTKSIYSNYEKFVGTQVSLFRYRNGIFQSIDLHWRISIVRGIFPEFYKLREKKEEYNIHGQKVYTLSKKDAFLHSCLHSQVDNWMYLRG